MFFIIKNILTTKTKYVWSFSISSKHNGDDVKHETLKWKFWTFQSNYDDVICKYINAK